LPHLRNKTLNRSLLASFLAASFTLVSCFLLWPTPATAAEVLQITSADRLIIGDRNRSSLVLLGCMEVAQGSEAEAQAWLRERLPRHSRVNLRPLGERDNHLLALVTPVDAPEGGDLSSGLIEAGLAHRIPCGPA
jgi:hypothetical protein